MARLLLLSCIAALLSCTNLPAVASSSVEVTDDGDPNDPTISVISSLPETTYQGKMSLSKTTSMGLYESLKMQYNSGEEFCFYTPVLGMLKLSCGIFLSKYWDIDVEVFLKDSEGNLLNKSAVKATGSRLPYATIIQDEMPRADVVQLCVHNSGSAKFIYHSIHQLKEHVIKEIMQDIQNFTENYNATSQAVDRIGGFVADIMTFIKMDSSTIRQDYFRLLAIGRWVNGRGICGSLAMLFCTFMSTVVIRRWFGSPRSSI